MIPLIHSQGLAARHQKGQKSNLAQQVRVFIKNLLLGLEAS